MTAEMWDSVGGFSEEFSPGLYSDPDLSRKLWAEGVCVFRGVGDSLVYQFMSKSLGRVTLNDGMARRLTMIQGSAMRGGWLMAVASIVRAAFVTVMPGWRVRVVLILAQAPVLAAVLMTRTRSARLGLWAGWLVILLLGRRRLVPVLLEVLALGAVLGPADVRDRLHTIGDRSNTSNSERMKRIATATAWSPWGCWTSWCDAMDSVAFWRDETVGVRQGNVVGLTFHPEAGGDVDEVLIRLLMPLD